MIRVLLGGDFCPILRVGELIRKQEFSDLYGDMLPVLQDKDLSILNLESPLTTGTNRISKSGPHLKGPSLTVEAIRFGGFDLVSLANNHMMDFGQQGLEDTIATCNSAGLKFVGAGMKGEEAARGLELNAGGENITVLAFAENEFGIARENAAGVNPLNPISNYHDIRRAKERSPNVIVVIHGGHEYFPLPSPRMIQTYRFFAEAGATLIVNHHQHVVSGYEVHQGVPIFYGLGNFLFDSKGTSSPGFHSGMAVKASLENGNVREFSIVPFSQCVNRPGLSMLKSTQRDEFLSAVEEISRSLTDASILRARWKEFCQSRKSSYLRHALGLSRVSSALLRRNMLAGVFTRGARNPAFLNVLRCESHREVLLDILGEFQD